ncbi:hypothetical protein [Bacillus sp. FSL K6-0268]|uniref:hypothetical protein n=1 Tax=Bacillus sp. FSL K6-0268 TaxID=2921449 RepID=UPI0030F66049
MKDGNDVFTHVEQAFEEAVEYTVINSMSACNVDEIQRSELLAAVAKEASQRLKERNVPYQDGLANLSTGRRKYQDY